MNCGTRVGFGQHKARNEPACRWCKEWSRKDQEGLVVVAPVKAPKPPKAPKVPRQPKPKPEPRERTRPDCGTTAAFHAHVNRGEPIDEDCRTAYRAYQREQYAKRQAKNGVVVKPFAEAAPKKAPRELIPCPSNAAYLRHLRNGEEACAPCKEDQRLRAKEKRARKIEREGGPRPHAGRKPINHGTTAGRAQHMRRGETPCPSCRDAFNAYNRQYSASARKKAKAQA